MTCAATWSARPRPFPEITEETGRERATETPYRDHAADIPGRTLMGICPGKEVVIAAVAGMPTEFPDRRRLAKDVIHSGHPEHGRLSLQGGVSAMAHDRDGGFGPRGSRGETALFDQVAIRTQIPMQTEGRT